MKRKPNPEMGHGHSRTTSADALVVFGVSGDLARKKIFPALYAMAKRGDLNVPVVGVAATKWSLAQLRKQATDSIKQAGKIDDVEPRYPARHYIMVDDKLRIPSLRKKVWGDRLTTVFPRQGHYALDPGNIAAYSPADLTIQRIGDLANYNFSARGVFAP
jgi:hypothetical protein